MSLYVLEIWIPRTVANLLLFFGCIYKNSRVRFGNGKSIGRNPRVWSSVCDWLEFDSLLNWSGSRVMCLLSDMELYINYPLMMAWSTTAHILEIQSSLLEDKLFLSQSTVKKIHNKRITHRIKYKWCEFHSKTNPMYKLNPMYVADWMKERGHVTIQTLFLRNSCRVQC